MNGYCEIHPRPNCYCIRYGIMSCNCFKVCLFIYVLCHVEESFLYISVIFFFNLLCTSTKNNVKFFY